MERRGIWLVMERRGIWLVIPENSEYGEIPLLSMTANPFRIGLLVHWDNYFLGVP